MKESVGEVYIRVTGDFNEVIKIIRICKGRIGGELDCKVISSNYPNTEKGDTIVITKKCIRSKYKLKKNFIEKIKEGV